MKGHARTQSGFTLIEVMIAIVIMAVISLIAWRGLDSMTRTNDQLQARTEETARLMRTLQQIEIDLTWRATIELPSVATDALASENEDEQGQADSPGNTTSNQTRQGNMPLLPAGLTARRGGQGTLAFEVVRAAPAQPGRWQRVQWWVQGGTLYRAAGDPAAVYPLPAPNAADRVALLQGVASFDLRAWEPGRGWRSLPTNHGVSTPASGLDVVISMRRNTDPAMQYRRIIALE